MNGDGLHYGIRAGLPQRVGTPAIIGARFIETLDTLSEIDALLARWNVLDLPAMAVLPLAQARPRIAAQRVDHRASHAALRKRLELDPARVVETIRCVDQADDAILHQISNVDRVGHRRVDHRRQRRA